MTVTGAFVTESVERAINEGFGNDIAPLIAFHTVHTPRLAVGGARSGRRLLAGLHAHFVLHFPHAAHALCHFHGFVDLRLARDKPAQLDHGFVGLHLDI